MQGSPPQSESSGGFQSPLLIEPIVSSKGTSPRKAGRRARRPWRTPRPDRLFDQEVLEGYLDWPGEDREEFVPAVLIIGSTFNDGTFGPDWRLRPRSLALDKRLWAWSHGKMQRLMRPAAQGGFDQPGALTSKGATGSTLVRSGGCTLWGQEAITASPRRTRRGSRAFEPRCITRGGSQGHR
jgi:hypothetical protein